MTLVIVTHRGVKESKVRLIFGTFEMLKRCTIYRWCNFPNAWAMPCMNALDEVKKSSVAVAVVEIDGHLQDPDLIFLNRHIADSGVEI